jgi:hypothetical protein
MMTSVHDVIHEQHLREIRQDVEKWRLANMVRKTQPRQSYAQTAKTLAHKLSAGIRLLQFFLS